MYGVAANKSRGTADADDAEADINALMVELDGDEFGAEDEVRRAVIIRALLTNCHALATVTQA